MYEHYSTKLLIWTHGISFPVWKSSNMPQTFVCWFDRELRKSAICNDIHFRFKRLVLTGKDSSCTQKWKGPLLMQGGYFVCLSSDMAVSDEFWACNGARPNNETSYTGLELFSGFPPGENSKILSPGISGLPGLLLWWCWRAFQNKTWMVSPIIPDTIYTFHLAPSQMGEYFTLFLLHENSWQGSQNIFVVNTK